MKSLFSENMKKFEGYAIGKTLAYLGDPKIISFAGGLPSGDVFPLDLIRKAAEKSLNKNWKSVLQYTPVTGEKDLIQAIVNFLKRDHIHVNSENIVITTSGQNGLDLVGRLFLDPGDPLVIDLPTFAGAITAFEMEAPQFLARDIEEDGSDVAGMEAEIKEALSKGKKPKYIYVVPDFQNPSGITMSLEKRKALLELAKNYGIPIVEDSPYRELRYKGEDLPSIYSLDNNEGNVIGLYTFSKILCPGLRVGFNIGHPEVIEKFSFIKGANILNTPKLNQDICTLFLNEADLDAHFGKAVNYYRDKLNFFLDTLEEHFPQDMGITWTKPEGGLFLWMTLPEFINTMDLFYKAVEKKVAFVPSEVFYPKNLCQYNSMRINFSFPSKEQIVEGIKRLSSVIKKAYTDKKG